MITVRKLKLTIVGDEETRNQQYKLIRDEQYQQYRALNLCMSLLISSLEYFGILLLGFKFMYEFTKYIQYIK